MTPVFALMIYTAAWSQLFGTYATVADCEKVAELAGAVKAPSKGKSLFYACVAIPGQPKAEVPPKPVQTVPVPPPAPPASSDAEKTDKK